MAVRLRLLKLSDSFRDTVCFVILFGALPFTAPVDSTVVYLYSFEFRGGLGSMKRKFKWSMPLVARCSLRFMLRFAERIYLYMTIPVLQSHYKP